MKLKKPGVCAYNVGEEYLLPQLQQSLFLKCSTGTNSSPDTYMNDIRCDQRCSPEYDPNKEKYEIS